MIVTHRKAAGALAGNAFNAARQEGSFGPAVPEARESRRALRFDFAWATGRRAAVGLAERE